MLLPLQRPHSLAATPTIITTWTACQGEGSQGKTTPGTQEHHCKMNDGEQNAEIARSKRRSWDLGSGRASQRRASTQGKRTKRGGTKHARPAGGEGSTGTGKRGRTDSIRSSKRTGEQIHWPKASRFRQVRACLLNSGDEWVVVCVRSTRVSLPPLAKRVVTRGKVNDNNKYLRVGL